LSKVVLKNILFISHDANRAGAQIVLLQLLKQLKQQPVSMHLLLCSDGSLEDDFKAELPQSVTRLPRYGDVILGRTLDKLLKFLGFFQWVERVVIERRLRLLKKFLMDKNFDLVFVNSIASAAVYRRLDYLPVPMILFAHELEMSVKKFSDPDDMAHLMRRTKHLIVVSRAVAQYFEKTYKYPSAQISTFQIIDTPLILSKIQDGRKTDIRQKMGLPPDAVLVGGCGHAEWRKGNDAFMMVAQQVIRYFADKPVYFVWVGMHPDSELYQVQRFDAERMEMTERVIHVGITSEVFDYLSQFDVFLLTSREDPYPLVVLEAALAERPIVCFDKSGGAPELVEEDAGFVVPYLDIYAMSQKIIELIENQKLRQTLGQKAKQKVLQRHDTDESVRKVLGIINRL
jgi:glycosyltransferase involved in cell wall biosynthesis